MRETLFHPTLKEKADALAEEFQAKYTSLDLPALFQTLDVESRSIFSKYLDGIEAYRAHFYSRPQIKQPVIWQSGNTELLEYLASDTATLGKPPLLLIPSLINKAYILDLKEGQSFTTYLNKQGHDCFLVNWETPNEEEKQFNLEKYVLRLAEIASFLKERYGRAPVAIGYCMGGTLATALTASFPDLVSAFIPLATPWDFEADGGQQRKMLEPAFPMMEHQITNYGQLPTETLQLCFGLLDPMLALKKFCKFAELDKDGEKAISFVALEDWLNDGVPLAGPTAEECLQGWYQNNAPAKGNWKINGETVSPASIKCKSLCIIPATDRIVPPESAKALAAQLPLCATLTPALGHIGMMSGSRAEKLVWDPIALFLNSL